jgi:hypothetical protein
MASGVKAKPARPSNEEPSPQFLSKTSGRYADTPNNPHDPPGFSLFSFSKGNFVGFVGNLSCGSFVRDPIGYFRRTTQFSSEGIAAPAGMTGIGWSDHWPR